MCKVADFGLSRETVDAVADRGGGGGGGGGGSGGCNPPKSSEPYIQNALLILC